MKEINWNKIQEAVKTIQENKLVKRIDLKEENVSVYLCGAVLRIDIKGMQS